MSHRFLNLNGGGKRHGTIVNETFISSISEIRKGERSGPSRREVIIVTQRGLLAGVAYFVTWRNDDRLIVSLRAKDLYP
jgi:hypothetical protein